MMKFRTNKDKVIKNGTTTIVTGGGDLCHLNADTLKLAAALGNFYGTTVESKGVAKLSPEDTYDESTGLKVATRKAEIKARRKAIKLCIEALTAANKFRDAIAKELGENVKRVNAVHAELEEINGCVEEAAE